MKIRLATRDDIEAICTLSRQINQMHFAEARNVFADPVTFNDREVWLKAIEQDDRAFFVAEECQQILGFITAQITCNTEVSFIARNRICRIETIVVDNSCHSHGVGQHLMAYVELWAKSREASEVRLEVMEFNSRAQDFYTRDGYETQSRIMAKSII